MLGLPGPVNGFVVFFLMRYKIGGKTFPDISL